MKGVFILFFYFFGIFSTCAYQSNDLVLATIDNQPIKSGEFLYAYRKNRAKSESLNYDSLKQYLNQYINFKLKVMEAKELGYDTMPNFKSELQGYVSQVRKPYLDNPNAEKELIKQTYDRMKWEINASHILINLPPNPSPNDTLKAYTLADSLKQAVKDKRHFELLAQQYSQDGTAKIGGKLGWFSTMDMVSSFEDAAYHTKVNQVSNIVKTRFGYHILYVNNKRASKGKLKTSHIFFSNQQRSEDQSISLANAIYDSLKSGSDWNSMARKYSDDNRTKMNGGQLPLARIKQLPDDFMDIAYSLETIGEISSPTRTQFGWHIVRLDGVEPIPELGIAQSEIAQNLKRMGRSVLETTALIDKLKHENNFEKNQQALDKSLEELHSSGSDTDELLTNEILFSLGTKRIKVKDFIGFIPSKNIKLNKNTLQSFYDEFEKQTILSYEDSIAPYKYSDYGYLLKEYEEGLLLFEVMQKVIWNKALEDTVGVKQFYQAKKENYKVGKRLLIDAISSPDKSILTKLVDSYNEQNHSIALDSISKTTLTEEQQSLLKIAKRSIKASEIPNFESTELKSGRWVENSETSEYYFINEVIPAGHYSLEEIRGLVISDFQDYLENNWINQLRKKRDIKTFKRTLKKLAAN